MRVLVYGGRNYEDRENVSQWLARLFTNWPNKYERPYPGLLIITGAARGVDTYADDWARMNFVEAWAYPADWETHGKAAGPIRNQQMIEEGRPDWAIAFPGGKGTADMTRRLKKAKIPILEIPT